MHLLLLSAETHDCHDRSNAHWESWHIRLSVLLHDREHTTLSSVRSSTPGNANTVARAILEKLPYNDTCALPGPLRPPEASVPGTNFSSSPFALADSWQPARNRTCTHAFYATASAVSTSQPCCALLSYHSASYHSTRTWASGECHTARTRTSSTSSSQMGSSTSVWQTTCAPAPAGSPLALSSGPPGPAAFPLFSSPHPRDPPARAAPSPHSAHSPSAARLLLHVCHRTFLTTMHYSLSLPLIITRRGSAGGCPSLSLRRSSTASSPPTAPPRPARSPTPTTRSSPAFCTNRWSTFPQTRARTQSPASRGKSERSNRSWWRILTRCAFGDSFDHWVLCGYP